MSCVDRDVESVQENEQTVEVYLVFADVVYLSYKCDCCKMSSREVSCVDRDVESVQENEQTVEVYLVDFQRGELC